MSKQPMLAFVQPFWIVVGLLACCGAALLLFFAAARRQRELERFAAPHLLPLLTVSVSHSRRRMKDAFFMLGLACLFLALARPQFGSNWIETRRMGIDILIGLDVSKSMLTADIKPNRLQRAKLAIRDFAARLDGDRIGLLPFAGTAFLMCPLTTDYEAFNASLDALDVGAVPKGGTDIGTAIKQAGKILASETSHKIFVLITDGEDLSAEALQAAEAAKQEKMTIHAVGVGTREGELVPLAMDGSGRFVRNEDGSFVTSRLDEKTLTAVAKTTGGLYEPLGNAGQGLDAVHERRLSLLPKDEREQRRRKVPIERFPWPLGVALLLLGTEFLLVDRRSSRPLLPFVATAGRSRSKQAAAILLLCAFWPFRAHAEDAGGDLFRAGKYEQAAKTYQDALEKDAENPALHFNLGACLHKQQQYQRAVDEFGKALKTDDLALQAKSYYNLGSSQYFLGSAAEAADPKQAVQQWQQAVSSFAAAVKLEPNDQAAADNLKVVERKLEQLQQRLKQQKNEAGQQDEKSKENQQQERKDGEASQQKDKSGSKAKGMEEQKNKASEPSGQQDKKSEETQQQERKDGEASQQKDKADSKASGTEEQKKEASEPSGQQSKENQQQERKDGEASQQDQRKNAGQQDKPGSDQKKEPQQRAVRESSSQQERTGEIPREDPTGASAAQAALAQKAEEKIMGKMSEEEARRLLGSLKGEQGELNFIPQEAADEEEVGRDW